ncbi:hypothetical protein BGZ99_000240 [Dissophora globulifera]|uniref:Uncharacterized protein n=1 Tax=Dissophora globulifera TaxID=979702 RepID=A0A9P6RRK0_9FUNG|nr:hypothetical protein BGZ99_000240 [Dissophora globulifera]
MVKTLASLLIVVATFSGVLAGFRDNCSGSGRCNKGMGPTCIGAFNRFTESTVYDGYTSRVNGNCAAIYRCNGDYPRLSGATIRSLFQPIYDGQGCKGCGSHAFNDGNCEVTLNFCSNCLDSGNPN